MKKALFVLALLAALTGCLEKDVTQTLYIEADGSVTWEVLERNVYSPSDAAEDRRREEREYLELALSGRPTVLDALAEIGGTDLGSELLRDRAPYSLRATARFENPGTALSGLVEAAEIGATVRLEVDGTRRVLTLTPAEFDPRVQEDSPARTLLASDEIRFTLAAGRFEESEGFRIEDGGRTAVWFGETEGDLKIRLFRLVWSVADTRQSPSW